MSLRGELVVGERVTEQWTLVGVAAGVAAKEVALLLVGRGVEVGVALVVNRVDTRVGAAKRGGIANHVARMARDGKEAVNRLDQALDVGLGVGRARHAVAKRFGRQVGAGPQRRVAGPAPGRDRLERRVGKARVVERATRQVVLSQPGVVATSTIVQPARGHHGLVGFDRQQLAALSDTAVLPSLAEVALVTAGRRTGLLETERLRRAGLVYPSRLPGFAPADLPSRWADAARLPLQRAATIGRRPIDRQVSRCHPAGIRRRRIGGGGRRLAATGRQQERRQQQRGWMASPTVRRGGKAR